MLVRSLHEIDPQHLEEVKVQMIEMGAPAIRVYNDGEVLWALEGTHRLAAAFELGITPEFVEMGLEDEIDHDCDLVDEKTVAAIWSHYYDCLTRWTGNEYEFDA